MRPSIVASSAGVPSSSVGILGGLLYRFGGVMLTVMCSDRLRRPRSYPNVIEVSNVRCNATILECTGTDWWIVASINCA